MLIIAYPRDPDLLALTPFIKRDPQLVVIDRMLQDRKLILLVANDLALSAPQALWNGRPATPVVVTLRVAVARRLKNWSYRVAEKEINGSIQWRWFCALDREPCPNYTTLRDREALIRPPTLHRLNDRVARLAQREGVTQGQKLRADGSVIETHIHSPTDRQPARRQRAGHRAGVGGSAAPAQTAYACEQALVPRFASASETSSAPDCPTAARDKGSKNP